MRTNSIPEGGAKYLEAQEVLEKRITDKYLNGRTLEHDMMNELIIWSKDPADAKAMVKSFMMDDAAQIDFLSDITAYENSDGEDGEGRFILVYQLYSTVLHVRIRIKTRLGETQQAETLTDVFLGANWLEREVYDMFGITFAGHPNLRRIMMDERFSGHPLRKEYPIKQREPFADNIRLHMGANPREVDTEIKEGGN